MPVQIPQEREEASRDQMLSLSIKEPQRLFSLANALIDPVLLAIPETPQFCLNSGQQLRLIDVETLAGMQASDRDNRALIVTIDNSGPTGIGYIMTAAPDDVDDLTKALDQVLKAWHAQFPMDNYAAAEDEEGKQLELYYHERWLDIIDRFLDKCAWNALPEEVRQIPLLRNQLQESQEELDNLPEDLEILAGRVADFEREIGVLEAQYEQIEMEQAEVDSEDEAVESDADSNSEIATDIDTDLESDGEEVNEENMTDNDSPFKEINNALAAMQKRRAECITMVASHVNLRTEILQIQEQLDAVQAIRDGLVLDEVKSQALIHAQVDVAMANRAKWCGLINFDQDDPTHTLTEDQFTALVFQAVDALAARHYTTLAEQDTGILSQQLAARREMQSEKRSNAEGSLRTQATAEGDIHQLTASEIRDPINRTLYIDVAQSSEGSAFRDIIIGACLWVIDHPPLGFNLPLVPPEIIQEFITQKKESDPTYPDITKELFKQFSKNKRVFPPEQMAALADVGLHPAPANLLDPAAHRGLTNYGLLTRGRSAGSIPEAASVNVANALESLSP